jgi:hypothetical protein
MTNAALRHDRNIKRDSYEVGDLVLCDHPKIAKGVARGLAKKWYGPFTVKERVNDVDYVLTRLGDTKPKKYRIHCNRLRYFFIKE